MRRDAGGGGWKVFFCPFYALVSAIHKYGVCCSDYRFDLISFFILGSGCLLFWRRDCKNLSSFAPSG